MPKAPLPDVHEFLERPSEGPCKYARATTPEHRAIIREQVDAGVRKWTAFQRWLAACDIYIDSATMMRHFERGHDDDR